MDIVPAPSWFNKSILSNTKCPSGVWQNGSGDIIISTSSSYGAVTPRIIKKNGVSAVTNPAGPTAGVYTFSNMEPATYIVEYTIPSCSNKLYDTFQLQPYSYPALQQSAAYQCDNNSFSLSAAVTGGVGPFTYEVIGSMPASPSIIAPAQASPVFGINNGTIYSLIRLRSVDNCGNATLNDVSILPLANTIVTASSNCFYNAIVLNVDPIPNATYQWFKFNATRTDSTLLGTGTTYNIPYLLPSDTGRYVAKLSVNGGCLTQLSYFQVSDYCGAILPSKVNLTGKNINGTNQLSWTAENEENLLEYVVEKSSTQHGEFKQISKVASRRLGKSVYFFTDNELPGTNSFYRVRIVDKGNNFTFTNVVTFRSASTSGVSVFPNPVKDVMNISIRNKEAQTLKLTLMNAAGQTIYESTQHNVQNATIHYRRPQSVKPGVYVLKINNLSTGESNSHKVMFE
jgi:hypothetical protein